MDEGSDKIVGGHMCPPLLHPAPHLGYYFAVEEVYDTVCKGGIVLGVSYHDDGGALLVEVREQVHHIQAVLGV